MNPRTIQQTLFRLQLDPDFRRAFFAGETGSDDGLEPAERALLLAADPAGVAADLAGRRRDQVLGNILGEFLVTVAAVPDELTASGFPGDFFGSDEFHHAVASEGRLPLAFADWAERCAAALDDAAFIALVRLDAEMARARRLSRTTAEPAAGEVVLEPRHRLVDLPVGTVDSAAALRAGKTAPASPGEGVETALVSVTSGPSRHQLPEVSVEVLSTAVADLLRAAETPLSVAGRAEIAARHGADADAMEGFCEGLVEDGVLRRH